MTELIAICDLCRRPIADGTGSLYVDLAEIREYEHEVREWHMDHARVSNLSDILGYPARPCWRVRHEACEPDRDVLTYAIDVERVRSWRDLARWTAHLFDKNWFAATDWGSLMRDVAENTGTRIQAAGGWERAA